VCTPDVFSDSLKVEKQFGLANLALVICFEDKLIPALVAGLGLVVHLGVLPKPVLEHLFPANVTLAYAALVKIIGEHPLLLLLARGHRGHLDPRECWVRPLVLGHGELVVLDEVVADVEHAEREVHLAHFALVVGEFSELVFVFATDSMLLSDMFHDEVM